MEISGANDYKALGNEAFFAKDYDRAVELYSLAIEKDAGNAALYRWSPKSGGTCTLVSCSAGH